MVYDWINGESVPVSEEEQAERDRIWWETHKDDNELTEAEALEILLGGTP